MYSEVVQSVNIMIAILLVSVGIAIYYIFMYDTWYPNEQVSEDSSLGDAGREMRAGLRPYPTYPAKKVGPNFDENGQYIYPEGSGFNYMERLDPNSEWGGKVS